jgi:hypothetical protein
MDKNKNRREEGKKEKEKKKETGHKTDTNSGSQGPSHIPSLPANQGHDVVDRVAAPTLALEVKPLRCPELHEIIVHLLVLGDEGFNVRLGYLELQEAHVPPHDGNHKDTNGCRLVGQRRQ